MVTDSMSVAQLCDESLVVRFASRDKYRVIICVTVMATFWPASTGFDVPRLAENLSIGNM